MGVVKALPHEGWSAPISFLSNAVRAPQGVWGSTGAQLAAPSALGASPPPQWAGNIALQLRNHCTSRDWGCKGASTQMCPGFRDGGRALTLLCSCS